MEKLIAELMRLFIPAGAPAAALLAERLLGNDTEPLSLVSPEGLTRALAIGFDKTLEDGEAGHWARLCETANALQAEHGFPAPAVSVTGHGYCLWMSLESPLPLAQARQFGSLLRQRYFPDLVPQAEAAPAELPPCLDAGSGRWAAFIHPGMGASFADEPWLEMTPPPLAQAAFLENLHSVSPAQFARAFAALSGTGLPVAPGAPMTPAPASAPDGLLLKDASLEDIVRHLHAKNIEPTFRHLVPAGGR